MLMSDLGLDMLPWQRLVLGDWCANDEQARPSYTTCGLDVSRQNGKNVVVEGYTDYRIAVCGWHVLHTAHRVKTAKKAFNRLVRYFTDKDHPEMMALVKQIRRTNGEEAIFLTNGGSIEFMARTNSGARGFDDIQLVVYDEAQELTDEQFAAVSFTLAASSTGERQSIFLGTPPNESCPGTVFARVRGAALEGKSRKTNWNSWSVEKLPKADCAFEDVVEDVYAANPSMGYLLDEDYTSSEFTGCTMLDFAHERLGWWSDVVAVARAIPRKAWEGSAIESIGGDYPRRTAFGLRFSPDGKRWAMAGCKSDGRGGYAVELVACGEQADGTRGLADFLIARRGSACAVAIDGIGAADALDEQLQELKAPKGYVVRPKAADVITAASVFVEMLAARRCRHTSSPQLDESARLAVRRAIGARGGWGFGTDGKCDSTPVEACSLALMACKASKRNPKRKQRLQ